jgi:amino acid adenylation domain-containing protein
VNVESTADQYELSPIQEGMLFHHLMGEHSGVDVEQIVIDLNEPLDAEALERAWQRVVDRHAVLRTSFLSEGLAKPLQRVHQSVRIAIERQDSGDAESYLQTDRRRGFDLREVPLMRLALFHFGGDRYRLVWSFHHILVDGRSFVIILREVFQIYNALYRGEVLALPDPQPFRDYIKWIKNRDLSGAAEFWKKKLKGFAAPTPLLVDPSADPNKEYRYGEAELRLPLEVSDRLRAFARSAGVTLNTLIQGAWALLLSRYSGEEDIVFGATKTTRRSSVPGAESIIGLFLATIPVRTRVEPERPVRDWLQELRAEWVTLREHEHTPLVTIREASEIVGGAPLFDTLVVFENQRFDTTLRAEIGELPHRDFQFREQTSYALTLAAYGDPEILLKLEYDSRRFGEPAIERMLGHLRAALEGITSHPEGRVADVPLVTEAERRQLLVEWNDTKREYPKLCVHQLFEAQADRTPHAVAVVCGDERVSYSQLNRRSNQLAHRLIALGLGPEMRVGICVRRSVGMIAALLGILKASGAYVPLDPDYPQERLRFMIEDAGMAVLVTDAALTHSLPAINVKLVCLDECCDSPDWNHNPTCRTSSNSLAYVMYTSGSTGTPKGVEILHRGIVRLILGVDYVRIDETDVFLQFAPISFDASTFEIWGSLLSGARCVLFPGKVGTTEELGCILTKEAVSVLWLTGALFNALVDESPELLRGVRQLLVGGEALSVAHIQRALELLPDTTLINGYGPTESTTFACTYHIGAHQPGLSSIPIGKPIANTRVYVVDKRLELVPTGVPGELCIAGAGLARGYLNSPELTTKHFVPNPFSTEDGARLYKTGDLVRYLPDGNLEFLGRIDQQVKIHGYRIELGEIEYQLNHYPAVRESVVVAIGDSSGDKWLAAYVTPSGREPLETEALRTHLERSLPDYMVPAAFAVLDRLPLSPNGKVDRRALPAPGPDRRDQHHTYVAPHTPIEELLTVIWGEVLHLDRIGIHDNFFELGGHSLSAVRAITRMCSGLGVKLSLQDLFEHPTIAALGAQVAKTVPAEEVSVITRRAGGGPWPPSFAQEGLLFLDRWLPNRAVYNSPFAVKWKGALDVECLQRALNMIIARHEPLRTTFQTGEEGDVQVIVAEAAVSIQAVSLRHLSAGDRERETRRVLEEEARRPFDLGEDVLLRALVVELSDLEQVLLLTFHHIAVDGWSLDVFFRELGEIYGAYVNGRSDPELPELSVRYRDYALWQRERLQGEVLQRELSYWTKQLEGVEVLELPTDRPRPLEPSYQGAWERTVLPQDLSERLRVFSREEGVSLFTLLLAAFQTLLYRYSGQDDICVGAPVANRTRSETEHLVGFFVNTLVLRTKFRGDPRFRALLERVRGMVLEALAHQELPFERLVQELHSERSGSHSPLFQVMFVLNRTAERRQILPGIDALIRGVDTGTAKFDLTLFVEDWAGRIETTLEYSTDLFDRATAKRMLGHYRTLLEAVVADPDQQVSHMPILNEAERRQLLAEWNDTKREYPRDIPLAQLVEAQVERTPDAVAVVCEDDSSLTYRGLNERANQLAHELRKHGAGPDQLVGMCMERFVDMIAALLAVIKAGAAYVPLDPYLPAGRLGYMIEDSGLKILLTQRELRPSLPPFTGTIIEIDGGEWQSNSRENPGVTVSPENLALVVYTSGSTGRPKGVQIPRGALINILWCMRDWLGLKSGETLLAVTTISFDIAGIDVWLPLLVGSRSVIASRDAAADGQRLQEMIEHYQVNFLQATPVTWRLLLAADWQGKPNLTAVCTGEAMPREVAAQLRPRVGRLWNLYGPTETTIWSTGFLVEKGDELVLIGRPVANTQCYILDEFRNLVPAGVIGELYIAGDGLARGYLNQPELTKERFVSNPFVPGKRMYRTGDLARQLPNGNIECLGRTDHQIKIRGFRVDLGEIEAALRQNPAVKQAVVVAREDTPGDRRLAAYLVPSGAAAPQRSEIRDLLKRTLPDYMVPADYVVLEAIPISPNGKIDRKALPDTSFRAGHESEIVAPRAETERMLTDIWREVLGVKEVGVHDNFFDLGGHSLLAARVIARIARAFELEISLARFFRAPTVEGLAEAIAEAGRASARDMERLLEELEPQL